MDYLAYKKKIQTPGDANGRPAASPSGALPNSVMESIARGTSAPTNAMLGRRESLAPSLQAKMQGAFGADFGNVEIYRSEAARDAGFKALPPATRLRFRRILI